MLTTSVGGMREEETKAWQAFFLLLPFPNQKPLKNQNNVAKLRTYIPLVPLLISRELYGASGKDRDPFNGMCRGAKST